MEGDSKCPSDVLTEWRYSPAGASPIVALARNYAI
jgi:hypothetical protein